MKQNSMAGTARHEIKNKSQKQREPAVKEYLQGTGGQSGSASGTQTHSGTVQTNGPVGQVQSSNALPRPAKEPPKQTTAGADTVLAGTAKMAPQPVQTKTHVLSAPQTTHTPVWPEDTPAALPPAAGDAQPTVQEILQVYQTDPARAMGMITDYGGFVHELFGMVRQGLPGGGQEQEQEQERQARVEQGYAHLYQELDDYNRIMGESLTYAPQVILAFEQECIARNITPTEFMQGYQTAEDWEKASAGIYDPVGFARTSYEEEQRSPGSSIGQYTVNPYATGLIVGTGNNTHEFSVFDMSDAERHAYYSLLYEGRQEEARHFLDILYAVSIAGKNMQERADEVNTDSIFDTFRAGLAAGVERVFNNFDRGTDAVDGVFNSAVLVTAPDGSVVPTTRGEREGAQDFYWYDRTDGVIRGAADVANEVGEGLVWAVPGIGPYVGTVGSGLAGYADAREQGYDQVRSVLSGSVTAGVGLAANRLFGTSFEAGRGVRVGSVAERAVNTVTNALLGWINNPAMKPLVTTMGRLVGETFGDFMEGTITAAAQTHLQAAVLGTDVELSLGDALYSGMIEVIADGFTNGLGRAARGGRDAQSREYADAIRDDLITNGMPPDAADDIARDVDDAIAVWTRQQGESDEPADLAAMLDSDRGGTIPYDGWADAEKKAANMTEGAEYDEGTAGRGDGEGQALLRQEAAREDPAGESRRPEEDQRFLQRHEEAGYQTLRVEGVSYAYHAADHVGEQARAAQSELQKLGLSCELYDGRIFCNRDGVTYERLNSQGATLKDGTVLINGATKHDPRELAGHEAFHAALQRGNAKAVEAQRIILDNLRCDAPEIVQFIDAIGRSYVGADFDITKDYRRIQGEVAAYLSGFIYSDPDAARSRFADAADSFESIVSAVDACYQSLMADAAPAQRFAGRTHPGGTNAERIPEDYTGGDIYFLLDRLPAMPGVTAPEGSVAHFLQTKREVERVVNEGFSQAFDDPPGWVDKAGDDPVPLVEIKPWDLDSKELLASKPSNSPSFRRWWEKENGKIYIRDDDVWVFVDRNGVAVPYPGGEPDFALAGVVQMRVNIVRFHSYAVDRRAARKKMGVQPPDTVLHHSREYGIIEVVDKTIHRKFTHIGWMAKIRAIKRKTEKGNKTG